MIRTDTTSAPLTAKPTLRRVAQKARDAYTLLDQSDNGSILEEGRRLVRRTTKGNRSTQSPQIAGVNTGRRLPATLEEATIAVADIASVLDLEALIGLTGGSVVENLTDVQASLGDGFDFEEFLASTEPVEQRHLDSA